MDIREGDEVIVVSGKDKGKQSRVAQAFPADSKVIVEGVATSKRHTKPQGTTMQGGIVDKDMPIHVSNVMILCPKCGATRIAKKVDADGNRRRACAKCGGDL